MGKRNAFTSRHSGAKRVERHGQVFQSVTEADFYGALAATGIDFTWQAEFVFQVGIPKDPNSILLKNSGVHKQKITVDFKFERGGITYWVDTKGDPKFADQAAINRFHRLKAALYNNALQHKCGIKLISYSQVQTLKKLALIRNKAAFWDYFDAINFF